MRRLIGNFKKVHIPTQNHLALPLTI